MSRLGNVWFKSMLRSLIISLVSTPIVLCLMCLLVFLPLAWVSDTNADPWLLLVPVGLFFLIMSGFTLLALLWVYYWRPRRFDALFAPSGLSGRSYMLTGRQYHGELQGRPAEAYFFRGPTLELRLPTSLRTRFAATETDALDRTLTRFVQRTTFVPQDPELAGLYISGLDEEWMHTLLADPEARHRLLRLLQAGESWAVFRQVYLQPGALVLRLYQNKNLFRYDMQSAEVSGWLNDLLALLRIMERLPPPAVTAEENAMERTAASMRRSNVVPLTALIVFLSVVLCAVGAGVVAFVVASLQ